MKEKSISVQKLIHGFHMKSSIFNSVFLKLIGTVFLFVIPIIILLVLSIFKSRDTILEQIKDTHRNALMLYMGQIESQMKGSLAYTIGLTSHELDPQLILNPDEATAEYAKIRAHIGMQKTLLASPMIHGYFLLAHRLHQGDIYIEAHNISITTSDLANIQEYVAGHYNEIVPVVSSGDMNWKVCETGGMKYLIQISAGSDGLYAGSYMNIQKMSRQFTIKSLDGGKLLVVPKEDLDGLKNAVSDETCIIDWPSSMGDFSLVEMMSVQPLLDDMPFVQRNVWIITILLILTVPAIAIMVFVIVMLPLRKLVIVMKHIESGDLDCRIRFSNASREFQHVNNTFNQMMEQVTVLKIGIYEEELRSRRMQLRTLQLQVKPHFLINTLNIVYNLMENEKYNLASRILLNSVDYFQYMMKADVDLVPLNEEIAHVRAYFEIQAIRYEQKFSYSIDIDRLVEDVLVPPMLIQNFVENSLKHAMNMEKQLSINISVKSFEVDYAPFARIIISDNGIGYPPEFLEALNKGVKIIDGRGEHIGIRNTVQRLEALFKGKATWCFYNSNGAVSTMELPAWFTEEG